MIVIVLIGHKPRSINLNLNQSIFNKIKMEILLKAIELFFFFLLKASLDEPTQTVIMHRTEPSRLQSLALQLSEKVGQLVENNERILEIKQGNFGKLSKCSTLFCHF